MSELAIAWGWQPRLTPVPPQAVVACGEVSRRLHARLLLVPAEQAARLQATANRDVLVVIGASGDLPWVDGVEYVAADPQAPQLWLSTRWQPDVPVELLSQALAKVFSRAPLLLLREPQAVVPLDRQLPLSAELLQRIDAYWTAR